MLTCKEAERMVLPYIEDKLEDEELEMFLKHIQTCKSCHEELEIYYTVELGLRQLENENDDYDIAGALQNSLRMSWLSVRAATLRKIICYAVDALGLTSVAAILVMQLRIWMQIGIF